MKEFKLGTHINCHTVKEQDMILDIFEALGYKWAQGQTMRGFDSYVPPMKYTINDSNLGKITHSHTLAKSTWAIEAKDLRNMWISLKRRKS